MGQKANYLTDKLKKGKKSRRNLKLSLAFFMRLCYNFFVVAALFLEGIMHIEKYKSNGKFYLRLVSNKRIIDAQGRNVSRKQLVLSLGSYDK